MREIVIKEKQKLLLAAVIGGCILFSASAYSSDKTRLTLEVGAGNEDWSYVEGKLVTPIWENDAAVLNFGGNLMNHMGDKNTDSHEASIGLIYRKKVNSGSAFWGVNASYSYYNTWDNNTRQTPHVGLEYVGQKFSLKANYMGQDETVHKHDSPTRVHDYYGSDIYAIEERFSGGWEALGSFHLSDRLSLGIGVYDRFGEPATRTVTLIHGAPCAACPSGFESTHTSEIRYLLKGGYFLQAEYQTSNPALKFGLQLKDDNFKGNLWLASVGYTFGSSKGNPGEVESRIEREYRGPVYKADPDDFGIVAALVAVAAEAIAEAAAEAAVEAAIEAGIVEANSVGATLISEGTSFVVESCIEVCAAAIGLVRAPHPL